MWGIAASRLMFKAIQSDAQQLGVFQRVYTHEPKNAPGAGLTLAIWLGPIEPYAQGSGLAEVTLRITIMGRIYRTLLAKDEDNLDPDLTGAAVAFLGALAADFTLGGTVRNVDLLGETGESLSGTPVYIAMDDKTYRAVDLTIPVIINDVLAEVP